jgi:hypothetical protein
MSIWVVCPSIRPGGGTLPMWSKSGYKVAVCRQGDGFPEADLSFPRVTYGGWAASINFLVKFVMKVDRDAEWFVGGADDIRPDPDYPPEEIARDCELEARHRAGVPSCGRPQGDTFLVMQPTGDPWHDAGGRIIERYAGSPWMGREWCRRAYGGNGPMWPYLHCYADDELQAVATKLGVFWQRRDLIHEHRHWGRGAEAKPEWWDGIAGADYHASRALFEQRKAAGWPGSEPIP